MNSVTCLVTCLPGVHLAPLSVVAATPSGLHFGFTSQTMFQRPTREGNHDLCKLGTRCVEKLTMAPLSIETSTDKADEVLAYRGAQSMFGRVAIAWRRGSLRMIPPMMTLPFPALTRTGRFTIDTVNSQLIFG